MGQLERLKLICEDRPLALADRTGLKSLRRDNGVFNHLS